MESPGRAAEGQGKGGEGQGQAVEGPGRAAGQGKAVEGPGKAVKKLWEVKERRSDSPRQFLNAPAGKARIIADGASGLAFLLWAWFYARRSRRGSSIFSRATENGCFVCTKCRPSFCRWCRDDAPECQRTGGRDERSFVSDADGVAVPGTKRGVGTGHLCLYSPSV